MRVSKENAVSNAFILCVCGCRELIPEFNKMGLPASYKHGHNQKWEAGDRHPQWKGGRSKNSTGYWIIYKPYHKFASKVGYVPEHHIIWEEHYKACLLPWGVVHHINEIRDDNSIENLQGMTKAQHTYYHNIKLGKIPPSTLGKRWKKKV